MKVVFITGSGRSGTTILENVLGRHPDIAEWYEPYYLWERYFPVKESDIWEQERLTEHVKKAVQREFEIYGRKSHCPIVLDKSPFHAFNIEIIHRIFPDAKWIHMLRDGRDVCLSLNKEWVKRSRMVTKRDYLAMLDAAKTMLQRQPFFRYKRMAVLHELRSRTFGTPTASLNKARWGSVAGYGPRFPQWKSYLASHTSLEFNAMQWVQSVSAVLRTWPFLSEKNKIEVRYETFISSPKALLDRVFQKLEITEPPDFFDRIPKLRSDNRQNWPSLHPSRHIWSH